MNGIDILACGHLDRALKSNELTVYGIRCSFCEGDTGRMKLYKANQIRHRWAGGKP